MQQELASSVMIYGISSIIKLVSCCSDETFCYNIYQICLDVKMDFSLCLIVCTNYKKNPQIHLMRADYRRKKLKESQDQLSKEHFLAVESMKKCKEKKIKIKNYSIYSYLSYYLTALLSILFIDSI